MKSKKEREQREADELEEFEEDEEDDDEEDEEETVPAHLKRNANGTLESDDDGAFVEDEEDQLEVPEPQPQRKMLPTSKNIQPAVKKILAEPMERKEQPQQQAEPIVVPRVVSVEAMLNEIYDRQEHIFQMLYALYEKLNK